MSFIGYFILKLKVPRQLSFWVFIKEVYIVRSPFEISFPKYQALGIYPVSLPYSTGFTPLTLIRKAHQECMWPLPPLVVKWSQCIQTNACLRLSATGPLARKQPMNVAILCEPPDLVQMESDERYGVP
ncbi:hypothetical protein AVEN_157119-1 [Araneus ventricosus]|uniref:Uncharacterized protein n=1 Tax=Araneus ventricosus TaxID=182803 RepID=A0A4Y2SB95_ARAVE|nr:hypothetical protein AVEN_157119-1 [Araneus ventricosus]